MHRRNAGRPLLVVGAELWPSLLADVAKARRHVCISRGRSWRRAWGGRGRRSWWVVCFFLTAVAAEDGDVGPVQTRNRQNLQSTL